MQYLRPGLIPVFEVPSVGPVIISVRKGQLRGVLFISSRTWKFFIIPWHYVKLGKFWQSPRPNQLWLFASSILKLPPRQINKLLKVHSKGTKGSSSHKLAILGELLGIQPNAWLSEKYVIIDELFYSVASFPDFTEIPDFMVLLQNFPDCGFSLLFARSCWSFWWLVCQNRTIITWVR